MRKKELALGTDVGNGCQLTSSSLGGRFRGRRGGEALLDQKNALNTTRGPPLVKDSLLSAVKPVICMILQHYRFFHS